MPKKTVLLAALGIVVVSLCSAAEFPLTLKKMTAEEAISCPGSTGAMGRLEVKKPDAIKKEPKAVSRYALYGLLPASGDQTIAFRLDESKGTGKGYDRLIFDLNRNGDLGDDPVAENVKKESPQGEGTESALFGPIEAQASMKKGPWQPSLVADMSLYNREMIGKAAAQTYLGYLRTMPGCYLEAEIDIDGVKEKIALVDANCSLAVGDKMEVQTYRQGNDSYFYFLGGDTVLRDRNGSGKFESAPCECEVEPLAELIYFKSSPYSLSLTEDRTSVRVERPSVELGELTVGPAPDKVYALTLGRMLSAEKWEPISPQLADGKAKVPAGKYCLYSCIVAAKGKDGKLAMSQGWKRGIGQPVEVKAGQTATLQCGAPLNLKVQATPQTDERAGVVETVTAAFTRSRPSKSHPQFVHINVEVIGTGGEAYSRHATGQDAMEMAKPPRYKVLDQEGKELASGQLEYG